VFVTDTVPVTEKDWPQLRVISIAPLIAAAVQRFVRDVSISDLY
jgi:ribose-phosphate pyrophosphokinase